jgi:general secretion pathway protein J
MSAGRARGFTLLELLVALFITAILFAMGYGSLSQALTSRKEVEEQSARLTAVQQAMRVIEQDLELMQPRPARDPLGNGYEAALVVSQNAASGTSGTSDTNGTSGSSSTSGTSMSQSGPLLTFTRGGWANPAGLPRSELQRVSYLLRDGQLVRQYLPVMDTTAATTVVERVLLDQVQAVSFQYMDESFAWSSLWPTPGMQMSTPQELWRARPIAVKVVLSLKDQGDLTRIIEVVE